MRHTPASLAGRLARLEQRNTPTLAWEAEVRIHGPDGERLNDAGSPPARGKLRAIVNVHLAKRPTAEVEAVVHPPEPPEPLPAPALLPVEPDPEPLPPPAPVAPTPVPVIAPWGPLIIGGPNDALVDAGEALARSKLRSRGEWRY